MDDNTELHPVLTGLIDEYRQIYEECIHITGDPQAAWAMADRVRREWHETKAAAVVLRRRAEGLLLEQTLTQLAAIESIRADVKPLVDRLWGIRRQERAAEAKQPDA